VSKKSIQIIINNQVANRHTAYEVLSDTMKQYSERVAHNAQLLFIKAIEKGVYIDYQDLDMKNAKYIFDIVKYFDVGYAFEHGDNIYSGKAIPMQHIQLGAEVFFSDVRTREDFKSLSEEETLIRRLGKETAFYHHERWDGHGFPEGLRMEEIPLLARICSICLAFENHTFTNSKKIRMTKQEAMKEIVSESGKAFDPVLVEVFKLLENELVVEGETYKNYVEPKKKKETVKPVAETTKPKTRTRTKQSMLAKDRSASPSIKARKKARKKKKKYKPIEMLYSPIVDIKTKRVVYYQSELVIHDRYAGDMHPVVYASVAEKTGQIVDITHIGLMKLLDVLKEITVKDNRLQRISIRVYGAHLERPTFLKKITSIIEKSKVSPKKLIFEIPESVFIGASDQVLGAVKGLREMGIKIAICDFGIGYSSITTLSNIDFDIIKIDKRFIRNITTNTKVGGMVRGILELVKRLDAEAICEGVETEEQRETLKKYGCKRIQGDLVGVPIEEEKLIEKYKK